MKPTDRLRRYYYHLTPSERIGLLLEAEKRGDAVETASLLENCTLEECLKCEAHILRLQHVAAFLVVQLLSRQALITSSLASLTIAATSDPGPKPLTPPHLASQLEQESAIWRGFSAWCRDEGHDPYHVLSLAPLGQDDQDPAYFVVHEQIEQIEEWATLDPPPFHNPHKVNVWYTAFSRVFEFTQINPMEFS